MCMIIKLWLYEFDYNRLFLNTVTFLIIKECAHLCNQVILKFFLNVIGYFSLDLCWLLYHNKSRNKSYIIYLSFNFYITKICVQSIFKSTVSYTCYAKGLCRFDYHSHMSFLKSYPRFSLCLLIITSNHLRRIFTRFLKHGRGAWIC